MKITSIEILPKLIIPTIPFIPEPPPQPPAVVGAEQHWYIGSIALNQELPGTSHETYLDAANGVTGSKYISTVQDETFVVGQSFAHFTAPPASPYESDTWEVFESFIDFDTSDITSPVETLKLRLRVNIKQTQVTQELLVAVYDWGGGAVTASDWHSPADLLALTPIGSYIIDDSPTFPPVIDIDLDPTILVQLGHTRIILYASETRDGNSPGGPGPTGFSHTFNDNIFFEPSVGNYPALSPSLIYTFATPPPAAPTITSVSPNSGSTAGGTSITITGTNFTGTTAVDIGGVSASYTVVNSTTITATVPAHASGVVDVRVTTANGTSAVVTGDHFTFVAPPPGVPTVTGISPSSGTSDGGTLITITGTDFVSVTDVTVDGASVSYTVINSTTITATTPAHTASTVDVRVQNVTGTSSVVTADHFTFNAPPPTAPTVTSISPNSGSTAGGTSITITGTNFTGVTDVTVGGTSVSYTVVNSTTITATVPAHAAGTIDVRVTNAGGTSPAVVGDHFTYVTPPPGLPTITGISPNSGNTAGGTAITITGTNFVSVTNVTIAGTSVSYTVVNSTTITATTPTHAAGTVDVHVQNTSGTSPTTTADHFTYTTTQTTLPSPVGPRAPVTGPIVSDTGLSSSYCGTWLTLDQEFQYLWDAGFRTAQDLQIGAAIAKAESGHGGGPDIGCRNWHPEFGFRPLAESPIHLVTGLVPPVKAWNPTGNTSGQIMRSDRGAWQISDHFYPQYTDAMCDDPPTAARIVYLIKTQIAGGWNQWNTYSSGAYQGLVTLAQAQNWINTHT